MRKIGTQTGYSLIELVVVIVVIGVIATIALRSLSTVTQVSRTEQTRHRLDKLVRACIGDPGTASSGIRSDYGYVGDIGSLPPTLEHLAANIDGLATWNGPYLADQLVAAGNDSLYRTDGWGKGISLSGVNLQSTGGPSTLTRALAAAESELLYNRVAITVTDLSGTPPGEIFRDSVELMLTMPDGSGGIAVRSIHPGGDGLAVIDSVPIGLHLLQTIYLPTADTLTRRINVDPGRGYVGRVQYFADVWGGGSSSSQITLLAASFDSDADGFVFVDDAFRSTAQPDYADGNYDASGGATGGGLRTVIGGVNNSDILDMSGGWQNTFVLSDDLAVTISLNVRIVMDKQYSPDEYGEALLSVDGVLFGISSNDYLHRLYGDGTSGSDVTTGWLSLQVSPGILSAGTHTITIGGFNNKKTHRNEETEVFFDDVLVTAQS
jgi:prepilin-type N-terminal cleavage/methylation domain-containing protein